MFVDPLLAALVHLRHGATDDVPACWFGVDRSTITRAIGKGPLLAEPGVHDQPRRPAADPGRGHRPPRRRRADRHRRRHRDPG
ncbi:transposase family protein, partial [Streptomyces sp. TX20-6-3]|uniref:helix-turn-helix domain-containing protein n=1 Tax=Streptomyces sp. TX20-6-3 TaxID=3028705 RepID=UPI0029AD10D4